jgi:hypothetical protein
MAREITSSYCRRTSPCGQAGTVVKSAGVSEVVVLAQNLAKNCAYAVFPCRVDKRPATSHGFKDASKDPDEIARLWRRYPGPLIGVATGAVSGIDVLDIDRKDPISMKWWSCAAKRMDPTRVYRTRSGGRHAYFVHADGVRNTSGKLSKGVDTRGDGGYIIHWFAAGCPCLNQDAPTQWPAWLLECVLYKEPQPTRAVDRAPVNSDLEIIAIVSKVQSATEGDRNNLLHWAARRLKESTEAGVIAAKDARTLLLEAAQAAGLPSVEACRTIASAWRGA